MTTSSFVPSPTFKQITTRTLGVLNVTFAVLGLIVLVRRVASFYILTSGGFDMPPFIRNHFYVMSAGSIVLLPFLAYAGIELLRSRPHAIVVCATAFCMEIAFLLVYCILFWKLPFSPLSASALGVGLMNLGLMLQAISGYPAIGLILLWVWRKRLA